MKLENIKNICSEEFAAREKIVQTSEEVLREAMSSLLDVLVDATQRGLVHQVCTQGGFRRDSYGIETNVLFKPMDAPWWCRREKIVIRTRHQTGYVTVKDSPFLYSKNKMSIEELTQATARNLAHAYVK